MGTVVSPCAEAEPWAVLKTLPNATMAAYWLRRAAREAGAYTRPIFSPTLAILFTPPRVPLSNRPGSNQAPNVSHKMCLR
jgi:hypothetical protein